MSIGLGLDTGGTNTDAVILEMETGRVLAKAKSPTTHGDLSIGIRGALQGIGREALSEVSLVSLSSTLATNSVVEGRGCRVALVCIGKDYGGTVPVDRKVVVDGGHNGHGAEESSLDTDSVEVFLRSVVDEVDAVAVNGLFAIRNPDHERTVKAMAREILGIPAVCGHELSASLGFNERVSTCIMNARLMPVMEELIRSVRGVLSEFGLDIPIHIVRGNGSLMSEDMAREKPVETVLSGPSASLIGAMTMTGRRDAVVLDMGGTTTDIGVIRDGRPRLSSEGMTIGGRRTHIVAARISTSGIGGDSRILVNGPDIVLDPSRVVPMCVASSRWSGIRDHLESVASTATPLRRPSRDISCVILDNELFTPVRAPMERDKLNQTDSRFMELIAERPMTITQAAVAMGVYPSSISATWLEGRGLVQRIGFTPTDLLHVLGIYTEFDADASQAAARYLAARSGMELDDFIDATRRTIRSKLCRELVRDLMMEEIGTDEMGPAGDNLLDKAVSGLDGIDFGCRLHLNKPIIGIGAPSAVYTGWIGEVIDTEILTQPHSDVGNAVGAISAMLSETTTALIRPEDLDDIASPYEVFVQDGRHLFDNLDSAVRFADSHCNKVVTDLLVAQNATDIRVESEESRETIVNHGKDIVSRLEITYTGFGRPMGFQGTPGSRMDVTGGGR